MTVSIGGGNKQSPYLTKPLVIMVHFFIRKTKKLNSTKTKKNSQTRSKFINEYLKNVVFIRQSIKEREENTK